MKIKSFPKRLIVLLSILFSNLIASVTGQEVKDYFLLREKESVKAVIDKTFFRLDGVVPKKVKLASYWLTNVRFTDSNFVDKLIDLKRRGTEVEVIYDAASHDSLSVMRRFSNGGIVPVLTPAQKCKDFIPMDDYRLMHNKFMVVDDIVITGSANFTEVAFRVNDEAVMVINSPDIARQFGDEFDEIQKRTFDEYISHITSEREPSEREPRSFSPSFKELFRKTYKTNANFRTKWHIKLEELELLDLISSGDSGYSHQAFDLIARFIDSENPRPY